MSNYEISKLEALRWTMRTWARVYFKIESKLGAAEKLGMPTWFPFYCGCCAYVAGEPAVNMEYYDCIDEDRPCPCLRSGKRIWISILTRAYLVSVRNRRINSG